VLVLLESDFLNLKKFIVLFHDNDVGSEHFSL